MRRLLAVLLSAVLLLGFGGGTAASAAGTLTANPDFLEVTLKPAAKTSRTITVTGATGALRVTTDKAYLSGSAAGNTVTVTVDAAGLAVGLSDLGTVTITDGTLSVQVPVSITVSAGGVGGTALTADPARLDFGTLEAGATKLLSLRVTVSAEGNVSAAAAPTQSWIAVAPATFTSTTQSIVVKVNTAGMAAGQSMTGSVRVDAGRLGTLEVPVLVTIAAPAAPVETVTASPFRDVPDNHWAMKAIAAMHKLKVISGYEDGTFRPDQLVTREQFAKIMVAALQLPLVRPALPTYRDVPPDRWSYPYIETAKPYLTGYTDGLYRPAEPATREDIAAALVLAKGLDQEPPPDPSELDVIFSDGATINPPGLKLLIVRAVKAKLISGFDDGTFRPREPLTRAQAAVLLQRANQVASVVTKTVPGETSAPVGSVGPSGGTPLPPPGSATATTPAGGPADTATPLPSASDTGLSGKYGLGTLPAAWPRESEITVTTVATGLRIGRPQAWPLTGLQPRLPRIRAGSWDSIHIARADPGRCPTCVAIQRVRAGQVQTVWSLDDVAEFGDLYDLNGQLFAFYHDREAWVLRKQGVGGGPDQKLAFPDARFDGALSSCQTSRTGPPWIQPSPSGYLFVGAAAWECGNNAKHRTYKVDPRTLELAGQSGLHPGRLVGIEADDSALLVVDVFDTFGDRFEVHGTSGGPVAASPPMVEFGWARNSHRGVVLAFDRDGETFYRWAPGEPGYTKVMELSGLNYAGTLPLTRSTLVDMDVDSMGNLVVLDQGTDSIRYVQIFR